MSEPASIRNRNPGAMYPGPSSRKFGSTRTNVIGGGHKIAQFPTHEAGAAAMFDLLARAYAGKTLEALLTRWSGGNSVQAYLATVKSKAGLLPSTVIDRAFLENVDKAVSLARAMAAHEAGQDYPLDTRGWVKAHGMVFAPVASATRGDWMTIAKSHMGVAEVAGARDNPTILQFYADVDHPEIDNDETSWCAAFVGSCLKRAGMRYLPTLLARDYTKYGPDVKKPEVGRIAVFWRGSPSSWKGHVGFITKFDDESLWILGGNQGNEVSVEKFSRSKLLAIVEPVPALKTVTETVADSRSLTSCILSFLTLVAAGLTNIVDTVANSISFLVTHGPAAVLEAGDKISPFQSLALRLDLPWPVKVTMIALAGSLALILYREFKRKQVR